jgi:hypothetical protein
MDLMMLLLLLLLMVVVVVVMVMTMMMMSTMMFPADPGADGRGRERGVWHPRLPLRERHLLTAT